MNGPVLDRRCLRIPSLRLHNVKEQKNFRPSISPEPRHRVFQNRPRFSGRPAYIKASGTLSTSFFAAPRFFSGAPGGASRLRQFHFPTLRRGRLFNSAPGALSTSFFCTEAFFTSVSREDYLCFTSRRLNEYFVSSARRGFYPRAATPSTPFFEAPEVSFETPPRSRCRPPRPPLSDRSVRRGGRFLRLAKAPVNPFFYRRVTAPEGADEI